MKLPEDGQNLGCNCDVILLDKFLRDVLQVTQQRQDEIIRNKIDL